MRKSPLTLAVFLQVVVAMGVASGSVQKEVAGSRQRRQALHCQPDDEACKRCSSSCGTVAPSHLPECCEAYNACCDEYFNACKKCSGIKSVDRYFPEYCCASFTSCCELITTFTTEVKTPLPVRSASSHPNLKIPTVAAPKPTSFPGSKPSDNEFSAPAPQPTPQLQQDPLTGGDFSDSQQPSSVFSAAPQTPAVLRGQRTRDRGQQQTQSRRTQQRQSQNRGANLEARRGRITSRGRMVA